MKTLGVVASLLTMVVAGCGGNEKLAPVSGTVTLNGRPLEGATVTFQPLDTSEKFAPSSFGTTDSEGRFELETPSGERGAYIGKHRVRITKIKGEAAEDDDLIHDFENEVPPQYNEDSTLEFEVTKEGSDKADFELKAEKGWQEKVKRQRRENEDR